MRQLLEPAEHRRAQCVEAGERELHLRLDTARPHDRAAGSGVRHVLQERGLAGTSFAAQHQRLAATGANAGDESRQDIAFAYAVEEPRRRPVIEHAGPEYCGRKVPPTRPFTDGSPRICARTGVFDALAWGPVRATVDRTGSRHTTMTLHPTKGACGMTS